MKFLLCLSVCLSVACTDLLQACSVPVFRYALERWDRDEYRLLIATKGKPSQKEKLWIDDIISKSFLMEGYSNFRVNHVDILNESNAELLEHLPSLKKVERSSLVLLYPRSIHQKKIAWQSDLAESYAEGLLHSRIIEKVNHKILTGISTVWLLVESKDSKKNQEIIEMVNRIISELKNEMKLPAGVMEASGKVTGGSSKHQEPLDVDPENVLNSGIPLTIDFSLVRMTEEDREPMLRSMLKNLNEETESMKDEPMLIPFFGRGRFLSPMVGDMIKPEFIKSASEYLTEACSCQVKAQNPGYDSLSHLDWISYLEGTKLIGASSQEIKEEDELVQSEIKGMYLFILIGCGMIPFLLVYLFRRKP